jgi:hypothetical protein
MKTMRPITEEELLNSQTKHISKPLDLYFISFGLNLTKYSYLYPNLNNYNKIRLVRINDSRALGLTINKNIYFNIPEFEKKRNRSIQYLASLLISVYAHESTDHDTIDYKFIPPIKEVQQQLDKYYNKNNHDEETLPCYFSLALLGCEKSCKKLYECGKNLILNQYLLLRDNIIRSIKKYLKVD